MAVEDFFYWVVDLRNCWGQGEEVEKRYFEISPSWAASRSLALAGGRRPEHLHASWLALSSQHGWLFRNSLRVLSVFSLWRVLWESACSWTCSPWLAGTGNDMQVVVTRLSDSVLWAVGTEFSSPQKASHPGYLLRHSSARCYLYPCACLFLESNPRMNRHKIAGNLLMFDMFQICRQEPPVAISLVSSESNQTIFLTQWRTPEAKLFWSLAFP